MLRGGAERERKNSGKENTSCVDKSGTACEGEKSPECFFPSEFIKRYCSHHRRPSHLDVSHAFCLLDWSSLLFSEKVRIIKDKCPDFPPRSTPLL